MKFFYPKFLLGFENKIESRTTWIFCYVIKSRINLDFVKQLETYLIKQYGEIFPAQNVVEMKETVQY